MTGGNKLGDFQFPDLARGGKSGGNPGISTSAGSLEFLGGEAVTLRAIKAWQCTGETRWLAAKPTLLTANPDDASALAELSKMPPGSVIVLPGDLPPSVSLMPRLQQRFVRLDAPDEEWRDVPTVEG